MLNKLFDYYFWFTQPATILTPEDMTLAYIFLGIMVLAVVFWVLTKLISHQIKAKVFKKFWHLTLPIGLSGLVWLGLRYENTPLFAQRFWAGLTLIIGLLWLLVIVKYLIFN